MKTLTGIAALALLALGGIEPAQASPDSVVADPDAHRVVLENEHVRVVEALAEPGATSPMHSHPPQVVIILEAARVRMSLPDGGTQIVDFSPGQVMWLDAAEHAWEVLEGQVHAVGVEVMSAQE